MGRVKEAVLASLARPIVSSVSAGILGAPHCQFRQCWHPWRIPLSVPSVLASLAHPIVSSVSALWSPSSPAFLLIYTIKYARIYIYENIDTRIYIPE